MTNFSIQDLETFSGIKKHTIRIWEQRYKFLQPKRTSTLHRLYTPEELNIFLTVVRLNQEGVKVSHIAKLIEEKKQAEATSLSSQYLKAMHDLIIAMAEMDLKQFEAILRYSFDHWGVDNTLQNIVLPFCDRIGLLDSTDNKSYLQNVALIKETIKHKIYFAIEQMEAPKNSKKSAYLFLLNGEGQDISILYLQYLLKKEGYYTLNLGDNIAVDTLLSLINHQSVDLLITQTSSRKQKAFKKLDLLQALSTCRFQPKLLTIGNVALNKENSRQYIHVDSVLEAVAMFSGE